MQHHVEMEMEMTKPKQWAYVFVVCFCFNTCTRLFSSLFLLQPFILMTVRQLHVLFSTLLMDFDLKYGSANTSAWICGTIYFGFVVDY